MIDPIMIGHVMDTLSGLPDNSVHTAVTSPPYYGLRAYGTDPQEWGGDPDCRHEWGDVRVKKLRGSTGKSTLGGPPKGGRIRSVAQGQWCQHCDAWRGELGSEPDIDLYLEHLLAVFGAVRRILRPDGSLYVNIADSYASSSNGRSAADTRALGADDRAFRDKPFSTVTASAPAKSLLLVPERFAIAMQDDGWIVRERISLIKTSPMPESVTDRCTTAWEYLYHFVMQQKYWYDLDAVREGHARDWHSAASTWRKGAAKHQRQDPADHHPADAVPFANRPHPAGRNAWNWQYWQSEPSTWEYCAACDALYVGTERKQIIAKDGQRTCPICKLTTGLVAHYAAFPRAIPEFVIEATCPPKACVICGTGWQRIVERIDANAPDEAAIADYEARGVPRTTANLYATKTRGSAGRTLGWEPGCTCAADTVPGTTLDPFVGSGTTMIAALRLGKHAIGCELNPGYAAAAKARLERAGRLRGPIKVTRKVAYQQRGLV